MFSWLYMVVSASLFSVALGHNVRRELPPSVDLGYEVRQGITNDTGNYYIFKNIPYAQQPVGDLRFQKPVAIDENVGAPSHGHGANEVVMCPQAYPQWVIDLLAQKGKIDKETMAAMLNNQPGQTEACLVLDVYVPAAVFEAVPLSNASVIVWIHGGGFTFGSKDLYGNPASLIARSHRFEDQGTIFVSINYRLGMYGWLSGDDLTSNLGLYDQRMALNWIKDYIVLFGGGPDRVTVMGESAGAASIVHQITAFGGREPAPFLKAVILSPAFQFNIDLNGNYLKTLVEASKQTGMEINGVKQLRVLPADLLSSINQATVTAAPIGTFGFGPGPDDWFVTDIPQKLLSQGIIDSTVQLLVSHTSHESVPFLPRNIKTSNDVRKYAQYNLPAASNRTLNTLLNDPRLYPNVMNGTYPWRTQMQRAERIATDISFACTTRYLARARGNETYNLVFSRPPGWHADDVPYVFFNGDTSTPDDGFPVDGVIAAQLQDYITAFAATGDPYAGFGLRFPIYGRNSTVLEFGRNGLKIGKDDLSGERCAWIQRAMVNGLLT
ncbi:alpha/beta-hydrolase [Daldinia sp. FL1419]|nr:alpha/beta-hydrolase [Daldinia sp. FL1419]